MRSLLNILGFFQQNGTWIWMGLSGVEWPTIAGIVLLAATAFWSARSMLRSGKFYLNKMSTVSDLLFAIVMFCVMSRSTLQIVVLYTAQATPGLSMASTLLLSVITYFIVLLIIYTPSVYSGSGTNRHVLQILACTCLAVSFIAGTLAGDGAMMVATPRSPDNIYSGIAAAFQLGTVSCQNAGPSLAVNLCYLALLSLGSTFAQKIKSFNLGASIWFIFVAVLTESFNTLCASRWWAMYSSWKTGGSWLSIGSLSLSFPALAECPHMPTVFSASNIVADLFGKALVLLVVVYSSHYHLRKRDTGDLF